MPQAFRMHLVAAGCLHALEVDELSRPVVQVLVEEVKKKTKSAGQVPAEIWHSEQ